MRPTSGGGGRLSFKSGDSSDTPSPAAEPAPKPTPSNSQRGLTRAIPGAQGETPRGGGGPRRTHPAGFRQLKGYGQAAAREEGRGGC